MALGGGDTFINGRALSIWLRVWEEQTEVVKSQSPISSSGSLSTWVTDLTASLSHIVTQYQRPARCHVYAFGLSSHQVMSQIKCNFLNHLFSGVFL